MGINLDGTLSYIDDLGDITPIIGTNSGGITNLADDTTPELGGNLDVQSNEIISTSPNDIKLNSGEDIVLELGDFNGDNKVSILNSNSLEVASIDSYGNISTTGTINGRDLSTDGLKLDNIESGADVTDSTNVDAAGAVMNTDVTTASMSFVIDEDNMISNSDTKIPTQQSVKAYVDNRVASSVTYQGGYNATTSPNSSALKGYMYTVTVAGSGSGYWSSSLEIGDVIIAEIDNPSSQTDWTVVNKDLDAASIKTSYESNSDTNAFTDAEKTKLAGIEANATADQTASEILTAIKTVDGIGSGLDADLLDGLHATNFVKTSTENTSNLDTYYTAGMVGFITTTTGAPYVGFGQVLCIVNVGDAHNAHNNWITQLAFGTNQTSSYFRTKANNDVWGAWQTIWNSSNDGAGSGLDADLLDGQQGSYYLNTSTIIDEDNMISNSDTKIPTQQSVKAYVDNRVSSSVTYQGSYDATTSPNSSALKGYMYTVTVAGSGSGYWSSSLEIGDVIIAEIDNPSSQTDWTVVNKDLDAASIKTSYESNSDTNAFTDAEKTKLAGIEANATADQTASEILTAIKTVDGIGSGLDADLLDGLHATNFVKTSTENTSNLDTYYTAGMVGFITTTTGAPYVGFGQVLCIVNVGDAHNAHNNWITQLAFGTNQTSSYFRTKANNDVWGAWQTIWNSSNDGAGSGLDADLLDGVEGANYLQKSSDFLYKTITLESPTASDDITIFRTNVAITVQEVIAVSVGTTPSTTYQLKHSTDRSAVGNNLTNSLITTSTTTGDIATLSDNTIPVDSWIWLETTAASGTNVKLTIDIRYTID